MRTTKHTLGILLAVAGLVAAGSVGCTFKSIEPDLLQAPTHKYTVVAVGEIVVEDKLWEHLGPHFRRGLTQRLGEEKVFESIQDPPPPTMTDGTITISGRISEVDKGSTALRWIIGFGAGRARVGGAFEFRDSRGNTLVKFSATESYAGGAGIGGAGFLDIEDLMRRFGETVADRLIAWSRGERIE